MEQITAFGIRHPIVSEINKKLIDAAILGNLEEIVSALDNGADIHVGNYWALACAAGYGTLDAVKLLIEKGCKVEHDPTCAFLWWAARNGRVEILQFFLESYPGLCQYADELFIEAALSNKTDIIRYLFETNPTVKFNYNCGLVIAATRGCMELIKLLLENGADIHVKNNEALMCAAQHGHLETVEYFIKIGANIHARNNNVLYEAAMNKHDHVVDFLLQCGLNTYSWDDLSIRCAKKCTRLQNQFSEYIK